MDFPSPAPSKRCFCFCCARVEWHKIRRKSVGLGGGLFLLLAQIHNFITSLSNWAIEFSFSFILSIVKRWQGDFCFCFKFIIITMCFYNWWILCRRNKKSSNNIFDSPAICVVWRSCYSPSGLLFKPIVFLLLYCYLFSIFFLFLPPRHRNIAVMQSVSFSFSASPATSSSRFSVIMSSSV